MPYGSRTHGILEIDGRSRYTEEECEALAAADRYRRARGIKFLSLTQMMQVLRGLGWRKTCPERRE